MKYSAAAAAALLALFVTGSNVFANDVNPPFPLEPFVACRVFYRTLTCIEAAGKHETAPLDFKYANDDDVLSLILTMRRAGLNLKATESNAYGAIGYIFERD